MNTIERLRVIDVKSVQKVPHKGEEIPARVAKITDGDTLSVIILHGGQIPMSINVRVLGIDCPETARHRAQSQLEVEAALSVKAYVERIMPKIVTIRIKDFDKWGGRYLASIVFDGIDLSSHLLEKGFAREYFGKKKELWDDDVLQKMLQ